MWDKTARSSDGRAVGFQSQSVVGSIPTVPSYCPGWLDPLSIEGPFTRIAPSDYSKITINGENFYLDTAQMGWEFYYHAAKEHAKMT